MPVKSGLIKAIRYRFQRSIQTKLALVLLLVGFVSLSSLGFISVWLGRQEVQNEVSKRNREVAGLVSGQVEGYLKNIVSDLNFAARSFYEINPGRNSGPEYLYRLLKKASDQTYQSLAWIDRNGVRRSFFNGSLSDMEQPKTGPGLDLNPLNMANDPAYLTTKGGNTYYSKISFSPNNEPLMVVAVPVLDTNEAFQGSLLVEVNLKQTQDIVNPVKTSPSVDATLVDESGAIIASSTRSQVSSRISDHNLSQVLSGTKSSSEFKNENGTLYLAGYAPVNGRPGWGVMVSQEASEAFAGITRLAVIASMVVLVAIIIISFIAIFISKTITRPIRELAVTANRVTTTGNLDEQIPITSQDEVGELSASFNGMILALRKTRLALEHWNRELEHKVEVRTHELTRTNEKLESINDQLERANLHKSQFLANMSHELRTPLNAIIGFSEVLQDQMFGPLNEKQLRYVNNILTSGRHLLNLVNDVLDLSKVEAGKMELHWEQISPQQSIGEVVTQLTTLATKKDLKLEYEVENQVDILMADRGRFRQILYNLLSNAIKFTPQGGAVNIVGKTQLSPTGKPLALFEVRDTGIGINPEHQQTIFESFRQVDNSYSRQYQGTGLGLALTRKLVEMHGGQLWVSSEPGVGSVFSFTIPLIETVPPLLIEDRSPQEVPAILS